MTASIYGSITESSSCSGPDGVIGPYRAPLSRVKARAEARRGGLTRLRLACTERFGEPICGSTTRSGPLHVTVEIPTADSPLHQPYFTALPHLSDRLMALPCGRKAGAVPSPPAVRPLSDASPPGD